MIQRSALVALSLPALALTPALLTGASSTEAASEVVSADLEAVVAQEVSGAQGRDVSELWARALDLRDAERLGVEGELDRALDLHLAKASSPEGTLLLSSCRLQGDSPDVTLLSGALRPLIASTDDGIARGASALLGDTVFRGLTTTRKAELVEEMLAAAKDSGRKPAYRLSFASAAFAIGNGSARREASREMKAFLQSEDADLRAQGALALASCAGVPIEGKLRSELERLERVPDERGNLAASYLKQARLRELYDRKFKDLSDRYESGLIPESLAEFHAVLGMVERQHLEGGKVTEDELIGAAIDGMLRWMDPHSNYLSSKSYAKFFQDLEAHYGGIGAYVGEDPDNGLFTIIRPIYSGPAYEAGLKTDDKIVRINDWPTIGKPVDDIIKKLKGKPGTPVKLYVWRRGMDAELIERPSEDMVVDITRRDIEIPSGSWQMLPGKIGLIEMTTFSRVGMKGLAEGIQAMSADGMRALILDMRRNSGGLLTEAQRVADLFIDEGKLVVSTESRDGKPEALRTQRPAYPGIPADMPIVILTSRLTASAAEIVSGALQDHGRAVIVGKTTYGKGSVQQLLPVRGAPEDDWNDQNDNGYWDPWEPIVNDIDGDGEVDYAPRVKLTIARYLLPSGRSIHRELDDEGNLLSEGGVKPDIEIDLPGIERWRYEERNRISKEHQIEEYVDRHWEASQELFGMLAVNDQKNPELYPDFDDLMTNLGTTLARNDVRRMLRTEIRRRVQDDRGAEFPWGDFVEDIQLQKGIEVVLSKLGQTPDDVTEFGLVFDLEAAEREGGEVALGTDIHLRRARALIREAREGGDTLTLESLDELLQLLEQAEKN